MGSSIEDRRRYERLLIAFNKSNGLANLANQALVDQWSRERLLKSMRQFSLHV